MLDCVVIWHNFHHSDVIMDTMASQITSLPIVYATVYSGADQRKHQSSASLSFVRGIHRWPVSSPHKGPVTRRMFPFDDVIMPWPSRISSLALGSCTVDSFLVTQPWGMRVNDPRGIFENCNITTKKPEKTTTPRLYFLGCTGYLTRGAPFHNME